MKNHLVETLIGAAVIAVAAFFLFFAYGQTDPITGDTYTIVARVDNAVGVTAGTDVLIAGVKRGTVTSVDLDDRYRAVITMEIQGDVELPEDSSMRIGQEGLMGGTFVRLEVGGSDEFMLADGDELAFATGSVDLIGLLQQSVFGGGGGNNNGSD